MPGNISKSSMEFSYCKRVEKIMVTIIDYGMGNLRSVKNMVRYLGYDSEITDSYKKIAEAEKLILPGVGNFQMAMDNINHLGIRSAMDFAILEKQIPVLGICLGMQLFTTYSEEGNCEGLNYIHAVTEKFSIDELQGQKIPHMGWNFIDVKRDIPFLDGVSREDRFYFVHSYYVQCKHADNRIATTQYGIEFDSIIAQDNIVGVQFHPEKSHRFGMQLMKNFLENY